MEHIEKVWFEDNHIWIQTETGKKYHQPLEALPTLLDATDKQRENFYLWDDNQSIRWDEIDEDIHISNFIETYTVNYDNPVNNLLSRFPWLNLAAFAEMAGMHKSKLDRFRYGVWTPSQETLNTIRETIIKAGKEMCAAML